VAVTEKELSWKYAEDFVVEPPTIAAARQHSLELGVEPVSPAVGAQLAVLAAAASVGSILEIGTGAGVSALWLLTGAPNATLTSIDIEIDYQQHARQSFLDAGVAPARVRLIAGRARDVLPRMNDGAYDLVLVDADVSSVLDYVEHALRIARTGGIVVVTHALWNDRVADPARRDDPVGDIRALLTTIGESAAVTASLITAGDGLLQIVKTGD
jgi:predicted O-methyltransferase YrrM